jgi:hypothetical protein
VDANGSACYTASTLGQRKGKEDDVGLLDKLRELLTGSGAPPDEAGDPYGIVLYFQCQRCQTPVRVRVDRRNDLNRGDDGPGPFVLCKEVMDDRCFSLMHSEIWFDSNYNIVTSDVTGGKLISQEEYEALTAPRPAPEEPESPPDETDAE